MEAADGRRVRVLDLTDGVAGQFCGRLFADNGAEVLLVEPPEGATTRRSGPFGTRDGEQVSCLFWHLNAGKDSIAIDLRSPDGAQRVAALFAGADVVLTDARTPAHLATRRDGGIRCDFTSFGRGGRYAAWSGNELVYQALSGTMFENGSPGRAPLYGVGHRASYAAGALGYVQCAAVLLAPERAGRNIDVNIAEVAASMSFNRVTHYSYNGTIEGRDARTTPRAIVRCADGWAAIFIYDHRWRESCSALGLERLVDDPRFCDEESRLRHWDAFVAELSSELASRTVDDVVAAGQSAKVITAKAVAPGELGDDPQLRHRGFWDWWTGELPRLGPMFRFDRTPQRRTPDAPAHPGHPRSAGWPPAPALASAEAPRRDERPLSGVTVLDLTTAWAGPMATRILASLGAEVLKVEGPARIDDWRGPVGGGLTSRYPDLEPGERPYDRCYQFNTQNHDKRGLALDLKADAGRRAAAALAEQADVLIANFSAGTLDRMGLGWEALSPRNPGLIVVEMPAYGEGGPMGSYVALGPSMELMGGMASLVGYGDGRPHTTGPAYLDPIGGFNAAAAIVTALLHRQRTGLGQKVEVAQREAAMHWIGEEIVAALAAGADRPATGNRVPHAAPHDAFPAAGRDEWVVAAAESDEQFAALCAVLGVDPAAWPFASERLADRRRHEDEIHAALAAATAGRNKHVLAHALQEAGVPAAPVCTARDVQRSEFLAEAGLLQRMTHPDTGTHVYQALALHISGLDLRMREPAPRFGEHTEEVLAERLGMSPDELAHLHEESVIADAPREAGRPSGAVRA